MGPDKVVEPNDYNVDYYKIGWLMIGNGVLEAILDFFKKGRDEGIVRSRSCDESNIVRSRIL
ncbi:unnamed protein product [Lupinus luteus]|uniref:Uncharacterized protein n=1 Tax=Lupinus luteus TaxID=3873 RepID=A0AAV1WNS7_LUPLU